MLCRQCYVELEKEADEEYPAEYKCPSCQGRYNYSKEGRLIAVGGLIKGDLTINISPDCHTTNLPKITWLQPRKSDGESCYFCPFCGRKIKDGDG